MKIFTQQFLFYSSKYILHCVQIYGSIYFFRYMNKSKNKKKKILIFEWKSVQLANVIRIYRTSECEVLE